ncbi:hypothetical protein vseg_021378 [Gypsophila vaccaria]
MHSKSKGMNGLSIPLPTRTPSPPPAPPPPPSKSRSRFQTPKTATTNATSMIESSESEELQRLVHAPPFWKNKKKLSKQLSLCETHRDQAWEKRRRQILRKERKKNLSIDVGDLTDGDFNELRGSIELGFGFNEEAGQHLCNTLPALDLYFAVHRQLSPSPVSTPHSQGSVNSLGARSSSFDSPTSDESWKICGPGDSPQQVKTKLRHWAQAVACSVMQSF